MRQGELRWWYFNVLHCTMLYCTALYCIVLYCIVLTCPDFTVLYCTVLHCSALYCTVLYSTVLYCTVLYCTVLYCTVLYSTALYSTVLYTLPNLFLYWIAPLGDQVVPPIRGSSVFILSVCMSVCLLVMNLLPPYMGTEYGIWKHILDGSTRWSSGTAD